VTSAPRAPLAAFRSLVVKVGTGICMRADGRLDGSTLLALAQQMAALHQNGCRLVLVTSGAVGMGRSILGVEGAIDLSEKQALAAVGQVALMNAYQHIFQLLDMRVAQVLLTRQDLESRERYLNARNAFTALQRRGILPIVNENDSVATEEIKIGDNDQLASLVGSVVDADLVINLTSTEGLYDGDPHTNPKARVVREVDDIDAVEAFVRKDKTQHGTGGMSTKLLAARIAIGYGAHMAIAPGRESNVLARLMAGEPVGTLFRPGARKVRGKKRWIAFAGKTVGTLRVDKGALDAVQRRGRSLLAAGVTEVQGRFEVGDLVRIEGPDGEKIGRGLTNYSSDHVAQIKGLPTDRFESVLGFKGQDEVIHRDHLVLE
jgi:glutamate 5-kinase